jgi:hypothetical protein
MGTARAFDQSNDVDQNGTGGVGALRRAVVVP